MTTISAPNLSLAVSIPFWIEEDTVRDARINKPAIKDMAKM